MNVHRAAAWAGAWLLTVIVAFGAGLSARRDPPAEARAVEWHRAETREATRTTDTAEATREIRRVTVERVRPTELGPVTTRRVVEQLLDHQVAVAAAAVDRQSTTEAVREVRILVPVRPPAPSWRAELAAGWRPLDGLQLRPELYRLAAARRLGPVWLGGWASSDRTAGISLAVDW